MIIDTKSRDRVGKQLGTLMETGIPGPRWKNDSRGRRLGADYPVWDYGS